MQQNTNALPVPSKQEVVPDLNPIMMIWREGGFYIWRVTIYKDGDAHRQTVARGQESVLSIAALRAEAAMRKFQG